MHNLRLVLITPVWNLYYFDFLLRDFGIFALLNIEIDWHWKCILFSKEIESFIFKVTCSPLLINISLRRWKYIFFKVYLINAVSVLGSYTFFHYGSFSSLHLTYNDIFLFLRLAWNYLPEYMFAAVKLFMITVTQ